jgi:hypothetical protein
LFHIEKRCYQPRETLEKVAQDMNIPLAPVIKKSSGPLEEEELRKLAEVEYAPGVPGEGIVVRDPESTWSFKVINLLYKD